MLYLGLDHAGTRVEGWLVDSAGRLLARAAGAGVEEARGPCLEAAAGHPVVSMAAAPEGLDLELPTCPREHALLAGALAGEPGLLIRGGEQVAVLALDRSGGLRVLPGEAGELGLEPLRERVRSLAGPGGPPAGRRLQERMARHEDLLEALFDLASFPGPDPDLRGLLVAQARRLVELARRARARMMPGGRLRGSWTGGLMRAPLLDLFQQEVFRHLPEVCWAAPRLPPVAGAVLLARACGPDRRGDPLGALLRQRPALRGFVTGLCDGLG